LDALRLHDRDKGNLSTATSKRSLTRVQILRFRQTQRYLATKMAMKRIRRVAMTTVNSNDEEVLSIPHNTVSSNS